MTPQPGAGSISGLIVDAGTAQPLPGAHVSLEPAQPGALPAGGAPYLRSTRSLRTDPAGHYQFDGLTEGEYWLRVQRMGYHSASVAVQIRGPADPRVSVAMSVAPVALDPVTATAKPRPAPRTAGLGGDAPPPRQEEDDAAAAERERQRMTLAGDVRAVTRRDLESGLSLGETDLFRALQRLPGVTTRDDRTADLWVRGAAWELTRVRFDGLPLFQPTHAFGVYSGVNPDVLGAAFLYPGARPASVGDAGAAVLDLRTRAGGTRRVHGAGELSLSSGRMTLDGPLPAGGGSWMLSGRYGRFLVGELNNWLGNYEAFDLGKTRFGDAVLRLDQPLGGGARVEASGLWQSDRVDQEAWDEPGAPPLRARWRTAAGRVTLALPLAAGTLRASAGTSRYLANDDGGEGLAGLFFPDYERFWTPSSRAELDWNAFWGDWASAAAAGGEPGWKAGWELGGWRGWYDGPRPLLQEIPREADLRVTGDFRVGSLWAERRLRPRPALTLDAGLRLEAGDAARGAGSVRLSPRVSARLRTGWGDLSAGAGQSYQYVQSLRTIPATEAVEMGNASRIPLVAGDEVPAVRTRYASAGVERWAGPRWLLGMNAWVRSSDGVAVPDPAPGSLFGRPLFVEAENRAHGAEISARRLTGRWTAAAAYSLSVSELEAGGFRYAAPEDRRHSLDLTGRVQLFRSLALDAGWTWMSGAPEHPLFAAEPARECSDLVCGVTGRPELGDPRTPRGRDYSSVDLRLDFAARLWGLRLDTYVGMRNALDHWNGGGLRRAPTACEADASRCRWGGDSAVPQPSLPIRSGFPRTYVMGFRTSF